MQSNHDIDLRFARTHVFHNPKRKENPYYRKISGERKVK